MFVPQVSGIPALITRYLTPQEPPHGLDTIAKLVHFVRLMPLFEVMCSSQLDDRDKSPIQQRYIATSMTQQRMRIHNITDSHVMNEHTAIQA